MPDAPLIFLIAGEASGDLLGAGLMRALKAKTGGRVRFAGVGGERMQAEGIELFFPQQELAHFGVFEIVRHIPRLLKRIRQTVAEVKRRKPAALVTIDSPDFCFRVAKALKGQGVPLIHYVAPTVWAWRPGRAKKIARFLDHLMVLLPFEPPYFTAENLPCAFVGHPIVESAAGLGDAARFRARHAIPSAAFLLAVLPGSRMSEVTRLLPVFRATAALLKAKHPDLQVVVPTGVGVADVVKAMVAGWPVPVTVTLGDADKYDAFAASTAALACSGTISVELAMARLPTVIAYRINVLTAALYRHFIRVKYATLINIMRDRAVMPEFLQENCTPETLAAAVGTLLDDPAARQRQADELASIAGWLGQGAVAPSERAADVVLGVIKDAQ
jgi:lipid-A-disaccharide synthase